MVGLLFLFMPLWAPSVLSTAVHQELSVPPGGSVLFQVKLSTPADLHSIFWAFTRMGKRKMLAISKPDTFQVIDSRFGDRLRCQEPDLSLKLSDLRAEDSGTYEAQIYGSGNTTSLLFHLQVNAGSHSGRAQGAWIIICLTTLGVLAGFIIRET
ncbi:T-lymphocyte surface antigen Ly-9-like [Mantella aurantiaca]